MENIGLEERNSGSPSGGSGSKVGFCELLCFAGVWLSSRRLLLALRALLALIASTTATTTTTNTTAAIATGRSHCYCYCYHACYRYFSFSLSLAYLT